MRSIACSALLLAFLFLPQTSLALGRIVQYEEVFDHLAASIQSIQTCGRWSEDGHIGEFRVIRLFVYGQEFLFVDIIRVSNESGGFDVIGGVTFKELNNDHAETGLSELQCHQQGENRIRVTAVVENGHSGEKWKAEFIVNKNGQYEYRELL